MVGASLPGDSMATSEDVMKYTLLDWYKNIRLMQTIKENTINLVLDSGIRPFPLLLLLLETVQPLAEAEAAKAEALLFETFIISRRENFQQEQFKFF